MMAMVSGGRSTLNPNAPLFIPAALQQVEDFSPEWWDLVKSSTWFRDYWINLHQEEAFDDTTNEYIDGDSNDVADLLPESFDLCFDDEFPILEAQLEELVETEEDNNRSSPFLMGKERTQNGQQIDLKALMKNQNLSKERGSKFANEPGKYLEKPAKCISPKCTPRRIQQPR